jgi:hypothetical protein
LDWLHASQGVERLVELYKTGKISWLWDAVSFQRKPLYDAVNITVVFLLCFEYVGMYAA